MSHRHVESTIVCPNCGFHAQHNYCARCGQENHLHQETFWALLMHFIGHYFHYDSKFWVTLKTLCFKPGQLTIAYREKKRMRYIAPVSLYIFISAVFFIVFFFVVPDHDATARFLNADILASEKLKAMQTVSTLKAAPSTWLNTVLLKYFTKRLYLLNNPEKLASWYEQLYDFIPKVMFFMIPFMAMLLSWLYKRRNNYRFIDHTIFSLHYHTFFFVILLLISINPANYLNGDFIEFLSGFITILLFCIIWFYLYAALKKVYNARWTKTIVSLFVIQLSYFVILLFILKVCGVVSLYYS